MPRPRKSTLDAWLDTFADWNAEDQAKSLEFAEMIHRQKKRKEPLPEVANPAKNAALRDMFHGEAGAQ